MPQNPQKCHDSFPGRGKHVNMATTISGNPRDYVPAAESRHGMSPKFTTVSPPAPGKSRHEWSEQSRPCSQGEHVTTCHKTLRPCHDTQLPRPRPATAVQPGIEEWHAATSHDFVRRHPVTMPQPGKNVTLFNIMPQPTRKCDTQRKTSQISQTRRTHSPKMSEAAEAKSPGQVAKHVTTCHKARCDVPHKAAAHRKDGHDTST